MRDEARLAELVADLNKKADAAGGGLTLHAANDVLLAAECISSFLQSFSIRQQTGGCDESGRSGF